MGLGLLWVNGRVSAAAPRTGRSLCFQDMNSTPAGICQQGLTDTLSTSAGVAGQLNALGVTGYFADTVGRQLASANLGWQPVFGLLSVVYYGLHYMFASQTAHVGALYSAFLAMMLSSGEPPGHLNVPVPAP